MQAVFRARNNGPPVLRIPSAGSSSSDSSSDDEVILHTKIAALVDAKLVMNGIVPARTVKAKVSPRRSIRNSAAPISSVIGQPKRSSRKRALPVEEASPARILLTKTERTKAWVQPGPRNLLSCIRCMRSAKKGASIGEYGCFRRAPAPASSKRPGKNTARKEDKCARCEKGGCVRFFPCLHIMN